MNQSPDPELLSLNTATVREKWSLRQMIEGCARHGIRGIAPWRDKLAQMGLKEAARAIRAHDLSVTGLCRGGGFTVLALLQQRVRQWIICVVLVLDGAERGGFGPDKIAQLVPHPGTEWRVTEIVDLSQTSRGMGGFGSSESP